MGIIAQKLGGGTQPEPTGGIVSRILAEQGKPKEPGFVQGFAQAVAKPFLGFASQAQDIASDIKQVPKVATGGQYEAPKGEYDYGYLGSVPSFGKATADKQGAINVLKGVGAGLGVASNIPVVRGGSLIAKGLLPKIGAMATEGAVSGGLYGTGSSLQEGEGLGKAALTGGIGGTLGGTLGGSIPLIGKGVRVISDRLTTPTEKRLENLMLEKFAKGVKPSVAGKSTLEQVGKYNDNVLNAVKTISENEPNLSFVSEEGDAIIGKSPESLKQLTDAVEQTKKAIYTQYNNLAKLAGGRGLGVEFKPIAKELDGVINNKALQLSNPKAVDYAIQTKDRFLRAGKVDAETAQEIVQNYNKALEAFYRNPTYDNASQVAIDAMVANNIRKSLDEGIEGLTGKAYQELKNKYGSLKTIEKDVIKAFLRDERKGTKGLIDFTDILSGGQVVNGLLTLSPATIAQAGAMKAIANLYKKLNDPNRAIKKIFETANKLPSRAGKQVKQRLALPPASSLFRSEVKSPGSVSLGKSQSRADEEALAKFGKQYEKVSPTEQLQLPAGNIQSPPTGLPTVNLPPSRSDRSVGFPQTNQSPQKNLLSSTPSASNPTTPNMNDISGTLPSIAKKASGKAPALFGLSLLGEKQEQVKEEPFMKPDQSLLKGQYTVPNRNVPVTDKDIEELGAILFGEISNRPLDKKLTEARAIANVALNRAEKEGKTLSEVLTQPNQFQAYKGNQYNLFKSGKAATSSISKEKVDAVNKILEEIKEGKLQNNAGKNLSYAHRKDNTIRLYKDWSEQKQDLSNIK